jgi:hypothetical protein
MGHHSSVMTDDMRYQDNQNRKKETQKKKENESTKKDVA